MIIKEYSALAVERKAPNGRTLLPGFPLEKPELPFRIFSGEAGAGELLQIKSAFRPYGPGRKAVRPVALNPAEEYGAMYLTEILEARQLGQDLTAFRLRIFKGFRHQIRCHLAWLGWPILNDSLYGGQSHGDGFLALRAYSISFNDPSSGRKLVFSIPPLEPPRSFRGAP
jgi:23S rRNA pseudouridine1911/1915/1917 synthase